MSYGSHRGTGGSHSMKIVTKGSWDLTFQRFVSSPPTYGTRPSLPYLQLSKRGPYYRSFQDPNLNLPPLFSRDSRISKRGYIPRPSPGSLQGLNLSPPEPDTDMMSLAGLPMFSLCSVSRKRDGEGLLTVRNTRLKNQK